jgi:hypothetical protein
MRTVITFDVRAEDKAMLEAAALGVYRALVGDKEAEFPHSSTIDISPAEIDASGMGSEVITGWMGHVTVTEQQDRPARS